jgi:hypothetical protein
VCDALPMAGEVVLSIDTIKTLLKQLHENVAHD